MLSDIVDVDCCRLALGRKEIVMFFYLYAIIELIAFFLDSNIIPTSNGSYPVSRGTVLSRTSLIIVWIFAIVVRGIIYRPGRGRLLLPSHQWLRGLSVCRGWHTDIIMGALSLSSDDRRIKTASDRSFYGFAALLSLGPRSSLPLRPSRASQDSTIRMLPHCGLSTFSGL